MQRLRVAFVPGVTPDKWARVWREKHPRLPIDLSLIDQADQRRVLDDDEADMVLARLPLELDQPTPLHSVRLYDEQPVVVAGLDHFIAAADEDALVDPADLADEQLIAPNAAGWTPGAEQLPFPAMSDKDAVETAASGSGVVILPMSVARLHHRKDVVQRPVDLPPTSIALVWLRSADSEIHQDFVGVTRGRGSRSSR